MIKAILTSIFTSALPRHLKVSLVRFNILKYLSFCRENSCGAEILNVLSNQPVHWTDASAILNDLVDEELVIKTNYPSMRISKYCYTISHTRYSLAMNVNEKEVV